MSTSVSRQDLGRHILSTHMTLPFDHKILGLHVIHSQSTLAKAFLSLLYLIVKSPR